MNTEWERKMELAARMARRHRRRTCVFAVRGADGVWHYRAGFAGSN